MTTRNNAALPGDLDEAYRAELARREDLDDYETRRRDAIRAIDLAAGGRTVPLDQVACLLPEHPEWARYHPRRTKGAR